MSTVNLDIEPDAWTLVASASEGFSLRVLAPLRAYVEVAPMATETPPGDGLQGFTIHDRDRPTVRTDVGAGFVYARANMPARIVINTWTE